MMTDKYRSTTNVNKAKKSVIGKEEKFLELIKKFEIIYLILKQIKRVGSYIENLKFV